MIEFALLLGPFLFLTFFAIDLGRVMLISNTLQDTAFVSARNGAQAGAAGSTSGGASRSAFDSAVDTSNLLSADRVASFDIATGGTCAVSGPDSFVTVKTRYRISLLTPGLGSLIGNDELGDDWIVGATAVARCEVVR